jgi:quercetin dioxygenase-like cupin family protein
MELQPQPPTATAPAERFTGNVYVDSLSAGPDQARLIAAAVRFTPGARTNWHKHATGQTLHCTEGEGLVVTRDGDVVHLRPGDTVVCSADEEHWHGATSDRFMRHLALLVGPAEGDGTTWLEPVTDADYDRANHS